MLLSNWEYNKFIFENWCQELRNLVNSLQIKYIQLKELWNLFINLKVTPLQLLNKILFKRKSKYLSLKINFFKANITDFPTVFITLKAGLWLENPTNPSNSSDPLNNKKIWLKLLLFNRLKSALNKYKQNICQPVWKFTLSFLSRLWLKMERT